MSKTTSDNNRNSKPRFSKLISFLLLINQNISNNLNCNFYNKKYHYQ